MLKRSRLIVRLRPQPKPRKRLVETRPIADVLKEWKLSTQVKRGLRKMLKDDGRIERAENYLHSYRMVVNRRFKTCAGLTRYHSRLIDLNPALLEPGREEERNETILHEIAHVLAYAAFRHHGHSEEWRDLLAYIGAKTTDRCHQYRFLRGRERRYAYECKDCDYRLLRTRPIHKPGKLHHWYHPACKEKPNKGRFEFIDRKRA